MRILNWNTEANKKLIRAGKPQLVRDFLSNQDADVICLTEAFPEYLPEGEHVLCSGISGWGWPEEQGARKVFLWCRNGWTDIDDVGSAELPPGRFIRAKTQIAGLEWTIYGMCIPWHEYGKSRGLPQWQGACDYLDALRLDELPLANDSKRTILAGDFNLQIPPFGYPRKGSDVDRKREAAFNGWLIPTSGIRRHFIDHIAMSTDLGVESMQFISKYSADGMQLSDHNGVVIDVAPV